MNSIEPKPLIYKLNRPRAELDDTLLKLFWHKALGRNKVIPNTLKALDNNNREILLYYIRFWIDDLLLTIKIR